MKVVVIVLALAAAVSAGIQHIKVVDPFVENLKWEPNPRIVNGQEAIPHSLPYMVYILFMASGSAWMCGGALLSENYVLTAAHCANGAETTYVTLGAHNTSAREDTQIRLTVPAANLKLHEEYVSSDIANDIAVIKLPSPVSFTEAIQTVRLPSKADVVDDFVGAVATASGWGLTDGTSTTASQVLNYVNMDVISTAECRLYLGPTVPDKSVCTSGLDQTSVCLGDSGSPLVTEGVVIGVSAFVAKGCLLGYPSGWTRVTDYLDWIAANTDVKIACL